MHRIGQDELADGFVISNGAPNLGALTERMAEQGTTISLQQPLLLYAFSYESSVRRDAFHVARQNDQTAGLKLICIQYNFQMSGCPAINAQCLTIRQRDRHHCNEQDAAQVRASAD